VNLQSLLFWRKKPTVESVSAQVSVRNALNVVVAGSSITQDQFEALYCAVLEDEIIGGRNAAEIINKFFTEHGITSK
jgi:hypothetical protein